MRGGGRSLQMADKPIMASQVHKVVSLIENHGFNPSEFKWRRRVSIQMYPSTVSEVIHEPTGYCFTFDFYPHPVRGEGHWAQFSPGKERLTEERNTQTWENQEQCVAEWLRNIKREIRAEALLEATAGQRKLAEVASSSQTSNTPFTPEEREYIAGRIREIKQYLAENLPPGQMQAIATQLDELVDASRNTGRRQWMLLAVGTVVNAVIQYGIQPNVANQLLRLVYSFFGHLLTGGAPPPQLGA